jgi:hypothetical protein
MPYIFIFEGVPITNFDSPEKPATKCGFMHFGTCLVQGFFFGYHTLAPKQVTTLGCVWLGFYLLLLLPKANITTKGVGCHPKPQPKAAFA